LQVFYAWNILAAPSERPRLAGTERRAASAGITREVALSGSLENGTGVGPTAPTGEEPVRLGLLDTYIGFHLRLAQAASFRHFKRHTGIPGLRPGWFAVLSLINDNPGITPLALSRASGRDKSTITPVLRDLARERLISRKEIPTDRRSYALRLTDKGAQALAHLSACAAAHDRELDAIAGDKKPALLELLRRITAELD
jgi:DNA-binding MarR family transcriptional regulator